MFFVLGIIILSLGIALTIVSGLGTSPFDALLVGLSSSIGLSVGSWEIILAFITIFINALLNWEKPEMLGLITALITGVGIDTWLYIFFYLDLTTLLISKIVHFSIGLILIGFGTSVYLQTNFAPIPLDKLTLIIRDRLRTNIFVSRTIIYIVCLILAFFLNGPIGIGTVLTVAFGGVILNYFMPVTDKILHRFVKQPKEAV